MGINYGSEGHVVRAGDFNPVPLTLRAIAAEVREVNIAKGWRAPDGGMCEGQTFGDYIALAHSELSEALEAYRDHRLADATGPDDPCSVIAGEMCATHHQHHGHCRPPKPEGVGSEFADLLIRLVDMADVFGINLEAEYRRKIAYNRTRAFQHGGRTLAGQKESPSAEARRAVTLDELLFAIPDDSMAFWEPLDSGEFVDTWRRLGLPELVLQDATGEVLTLWVHDIETAARDIGRPIEPYGDGRGFEITKGDYRVDVLESKETKDA